MGNPNTLSADTQILRAQALALLEAAQALDGLQPFVISHRHGHGETPYIAWGHRRPTEREATSILEDTFDPDREQLVVEGSVSLAEVCGTHPGGVLNQRPTPIAKPSEPEPGMSM